MRLGRFKVVQFSVVIASFLAGTMLMAVSIPTHVQRNLEAIEEPLSIRILMM